MRQKRADQRAHHLLYRTTCLITNKFYIGMHSTDDVDDGYMGSGQILWRSIRKHGKENHCCEVVEFCSDRKVLAKREEEEISKYYDDPLCMNLCGGGEGPSFHSQKTRLKISTKGKGRKHTQQARQRMSDTKKLYFAKQGGHLLETKEKISKRHRGRKHTEQSRRNMSKAHIGLSQKSVSEETRKKLSEKAKLQWKEGRGYRVQKKSSSAVSGHKNCGKIPWNKGKTKANDSRVKGPAASLCLGKRWCCNPETRERRMLYELPDGWILGMVVKRRRQPKFIHSE